MHINKLSKKNVKRVVVKIGSSVITHKNKLNFDKITCLVKQIVSLQEDGIQVVVVTSGAIVTGMESLGLKNRPGTLPGLQAAAAIGQSKLMGIYDKIFAENDIKVAQVLLTRDDMHERHRYLNAKNTIKELLDFKVLPVINENDTVSVDEIKIGDNDTLSALVTTLIDANWLIILSDIDGLYITESKLDSYKEYIDFYIDSKMSKSKIVKNVKKICDKMEEVCRGEGKSTTVGGMATKISSARIVTNCGIPCTVANGTKKGILRDILNGEDVGTYFSPRTKKTCARKRWIGYGSKTKGSIIVDDGAKDALTQKGKSLLASGIIKVEGNFSQGDAVSIKDKKNSVFSKALTYYSSDELNKIKGKNTNKIKNILGFKYYDEVAHRDNLVLL